MPLLFLVMDDAASAQCDNIGSIYDASNESTPGLKGLLEQRHSVRNYGERKITIKKLDNIILHYSCGIKFYRLIMPIIESSSRSYIRHPQEV